MGSRPNVVFMLADNLGYADVGCYGAGESRGMPTPSLDQLAADGVRMNQFLVEAACTPSLESLRLPPAAVTVVGGNHNDRVLDYGTANTVTGAIHLQRHKPDFPPGLEMLEAKEEAIEAFRTGNARHGP